jgi:hypothetical protein
VLELTPLDEGVVETTSIPTDVGAITFVSVAIAPL